MRPLRKRVARSTLVRAKRPVRPGVVLASYRPVKPKKVLARYKPKKPPTPQKVLEKRKVKKRGIGYGLRTYKHG